MIFFEEAVDPELRVEPPCGVRGQAGELVIGSGWAEPQPPCTYHILFDGEEVATQQDGLYGPPRKTFTVPNDATVGCGHVIEVKLITDVGGALIAQASVEFCVVELNRVIWAETRCHGDCANPRLALPELPSDQDPGVRHFPDSEGTTQSPHDEVKVRAFLSNACPGVPVHFRSYDPADGSADGPPIRVERLCDNGVTRDCDNRGQPRAGSFDSAEVETDASGMAEAGFTTSMFPGDNYFVAASADPGYLGEVSLADEGYVLEDGDLNPLPTEKAQVTPLLTIWRQLHLELDSMENPGDRNRARGRVDGSECLQEPFRAGILNYCQFEILPRLPPNTVNQYEKGEFRLGADIFQVLPIEFRVIPDEGVGASPFVRSPVDPNDTVTVRTKLPNGLSNCLAPNAASACSSSSSDFELHDDDEDSLFPGTPDTRFLQDADNVGTNKLMRAFIRPVHDGGGANDVPFREYLDANLIYGDIEANKACRSDANYWCAYLQNAFQATKGSEARLDNDPDDMPKVALGRTVSPGLYGFDPNEPVTGAVIFGEAMRDSHRSLYRAEYYPSQSATHELGHLLLACHGDNGVMCYPRDSEPLNSNMLTFTDTSIAKMRWLVQPSVMAPQFVHRVVSAPEEIIEWVASDGESLPCDGSDTRCAPAAK